MTSIARRSLALLALATLPACLNVDLPTGAHVTNGDSTGDQGKVDLTFEGPAGDQLCNLGCGLQMALMAGDSEAISVGPHVASPTAALPPIVFSSSDPGVFDASPALADGPIPVARGTTLHGHAPGSATLLLTNADTNELFDSATVRVEAAASLSMSFQIEVPGPTPSTPGKLVLLVGQRALAVGQVLDAGGLPIAGWSSVSLAIADSGVASITPGSALTFVDAVAKGQTALTARAGAATQVITVVVE